VILSEVTVAQKALALHENPAVFHPPEAFMLVKNSGKKPLRIIIV
jgi:hypothetical protein